MSRRCLDAWEKQKKLPDANKAEPGGYGFWGLGLGV